MAGDASRAVSYDSEGAGIVMAAAVAAGPGSVRGWDGGTGAGAAGAGTGFMRVKPEARSMPIFFFKYKLCV